MDSAEEGLVVRALDAPRVLVVEDNQAIAHLVETLLSQEGYAVEAAATGSAALARLETDGIDLVLLDLILPDQNGLEVCRLLREKLATIHLPILMIKALASDEERLEGFDAGADDYITKPFHTEELLSRVRVWSRTRQRLQAYQRRVDAQERALRDAEHRTLTAQVEGIRLAARELSDLVNNRIAMAKGTLELVESEADLPRPLQTMTLHAQERLAEAALAVQQLERVVQITVKQTPTGPALDLARSTSSKPKEADGVVPLGDA